MPESTVVELNLPKRGSFLRMVRLASAAMASQTGFEFDQVEDIRVAVSELAMALLGDDSALGQLRVRFEFDGTALVVSAEADADGEADELPELAAQILDVLAASYSFTGSGPTRHFRVAFAR